MISKYKNYLINNKIFILSILLQIIFFFLYNSVFEDFLIKNVKKTEIMDRNYYNSIFSNFSTSIFIVIVFSIIIKIFYRRKIKLYNKITNVVSEITIVLTVSFSIQIIVLLTIKTLPFSDSLFYVQHAESLIKTGSYSNQFGNLTAFWPIGLPFLIYIFSYISKEYLFVTQLFNIIVNLLYLYILYRIFKPKLSSKELTTFLWIFILFPNNFLSANTIMTDFLFAALWWILVYLVLTKDSMLWIIVIGVLTAGLIYLRSTGLIAFVIYFFVFYKRFNMLKTTKVLSIIMLTAFILMLPWGIRNFNVFGKFVITSTNGGFNFLMGNHKNSSGRINFDFNYDIQNKNEVYENNKAYKQAVSDIVENPAGLIKNLPKKIFFSYIRGDNSLTWALKNTRNKVSPIIISLLFYINNLAHFIIIGFSLLGFYRTIILPRNNTIFIQLLILNVFLFLTIIIIYVGNERYVVPILPVHLFFFSKFLPSEKS